MRKTIVFSVLFLAFLTLCIGLGVTNADAGTKQKVEVTNRNPNPTWVDTGKRVAVGNFNAIIGENRAKSGGPWIQSKWNSAIQKAEIIVTNWDGVSNIQSRLSAAAARATKLEADITSGKFPNQGSTRDLYVKEHR